MAYIRYNVYFWAPPTLTPEQEIHIGGEIAREGREAFLERHHPYLSKREQEQIVEAKNRTPAQNARVWIVATLFFGPLLFFAWPVILIGLLACIPIFGLSIGSMLLSKGRYRRWVDEMVAKYAAHAAQHGQIEND
jgi:hypothetical protein